MRELDLIIHLPPCGRGIGPCKAVIETDLAGVIILRCLTCGCVAPYRGSGNHA
jgi:hypothetical protein